ncbi:MAG: tRNA (adenosine(37)-N6)-threonylcarbamoyltransferase complex dimerization subunit type 1 TsaB [Clostridia bacterium]
MNYLLINTANDELVIVLSKDGTIFACNERQVKKHNEVLLPKLEEVLNEASLTLNDIDEFGVIVGPGSFTGLRVGIATIKAFKDVVNKPVRAINNLDLLYQIVKNKGLNYNIVAIEGSLNSYFVGKYENNQLNIYERNLTKDELLEISKGQKVAMYSNTHNLDIGEVVEFDNSAFVQAFLNSKSYDLTPVYYQLSQAENDKIEHSNIIIREAELYDVKAICEIAEKYFPVYPLTLLNKKLVSKDCVTFVAQIDEQVVGFVVGRFLTDDYNDINIDLIVVDVNFRNHGIGTKLINQIELCAKENKCDITVPIWKDCFSLENLCKKLDYVDVRVGVDLDLIEKFKTMPEDLYQYSLIKLFKQNK